MLPEAWAYRRVADYQHPTDQTVQTGPFGAQLHADDYVDEGVPFVLIRNIKNSRADPSGIPRIRFADAARLGNYALQEGDIVFSRVGRVGSCFLTEADHVGWIISGQLLRMRLNMAELDPRFLIHWITSPYVERHILGESVGTTRQSINSSILASVPIPVVPKAEQSKIAEILDTVDTTIRQTEVIVEKLKQVKQGLLHDLLTRGIDANGDLRPLQREAPNLYQESPLGWIPRSWEVDYAGRFVTSIVPGRNKPVLDDGEYPWITIADLLGDEVFVSRLGLSVSADSLRNAGGRTVPAGTVLMSCVGSFGTAAVATRVLVANQQLHGFVAGEMLRPRWMMHTIRHNAALIDRAATQTTIRYLNKEGCESIFVPVPSLAEQDEMLERIDAIGQRALLEIATARKLRGVGQGLMDDLLTGRVRVTPLLT